MLLHFIKRDFIDHRIHWTLTLVGTLVVAPFVWQHPEAILSLLYAYFLFAMTPVQGMTGVSWRSQQTMSRSYILSLPVSRHALFLMIQQRALIYFIPLMICSLLLPLSFLFKKFSWNTLTYLTVELTITASCIWFLNTLISMQLSIEKIFKYSAKWKRFAGWLQMFGIIGIETCFIYGCLAGSLSNSNCRYVGLPLAAGLACFRFCRARRAWIG